MTSNETPPPLDDPITAAILYETHLVRAFHGMEARTRAKWEKDGWEYVSQNQISPLRIDLTFRRPKKKQPRYLWPVLGGLVVLGVVGLIVAGVSGDDENNASSTATPAAASPRSPSPTPKQTSVASPQPSATTPLPTAVTTAPPTLSEINAAQFLAMQWEAKFSYGGDVHWITDRITTANADGSYTFKIGATFKNQYGTDTDATIEGDVAGTNADPTITDSILYTNDGQVVNYNS